MYTRKIYEPENELRIQIPGHGIGRAAGSSAQQKEQARPVQARLVSGGSGGSKKNETVTSTETEQPQRQRASYPGSVVELKDPFDVSTRHEKLDDMLYEATRPLDRPALEQRVADTRQRLEDLEEVRKDLNVITKPTIWDIVLNPFGKSSAAQSKEMEHRAKWLDAQIAQSERDLTIYNGRLDSMIMAEDMAEFATWSKEEQDAARAHLQWRSDTFFAGGSPADWYETEESKAARDISGLYERYDEARLEEILESVEREQNSRTLAQYQDTFDEVAEKGGYWNFIPSVAATFASSPVNIQSILYSQIHDTGRYSTSDPNHLGQALSMYSQTVTEHNSQNFGKDMLSFLEFAGAAGYAGMTEQGAPTSFQPQLYEGLEGTKAQKAVDIGGALLYTGAKAAADDLVRKGVGALVGGPAGTAVTLGLAGIGSFNETYNAATRKGASHAEAALLATADAGVEVLTEFIPLDDWWATVKSNRTLATGLAMDVFAQCGIEIAEEELGLIITASTEYAVLKDRSEYGRLMNELMAAGYTKKEAERAAFNAFVGNMIETAAVTWVSTVLDVSGARVISSVTGAYGNTDTQTQRSGGGTVTDTAARLPTYQEMNAALEDIRKRQGQPQVTQTQDAVPADPQDGRGPGADGRPEMLRKEMTDTSDVPYFTTDHWTGELEGLWTETDTRTAADTAADTSIDMDGVYGTDTVDAGTETRQKPMRYEDALRAYLRGDMDLSTTPDVQKSVPNVKVDADTEAGPTVGSDNTQGTAPKPKTQVISELAQKISKPGITPGRAMIAAEQTYADAEKRFGPDAQTVLEQLRPGQDPRRFLDGFQNAYILGKQSASMNTLNNSKSAAYLTQEQREFAYGLGQRLNGRMGQSQGRRERGRDDAVWPAKRATISRNEYKEIMRFARDKGIELAGFKYYDGKIETIHGLVEEVSRIAECFPGLSDDRRRLTIELSRTLDQDTFAQTHGRIVGINIDAYRDTEFLEAEYQKLVEQGWFVKGTNSHAIIAHEMGHVVEMVFGIDPLTLAQKVSGVNRNEVLDFCEKNLSGYSAAYSDGTEIISECFASVFGSSERNEFALKIVELCVKIALGKE